MLRSDTPRTAHEHINSMSDRIQRLELRTPPKVQGIEFYAQPDPPATAGYAAFWLDTAP